MACKPVFKTKKLVDIYGLLSNPNALQTHFVQDFIHEKVEKSNYKFMTVLVKNPNAEEIVEKYLPEFENDKKIPYKFNLFSNPNMMNLAKKILSRMQCDDIVPLMGLCQNPNPEAMRILEERLEKLDPAKRLNLKLGGKIASNPSALPILHKYKDLIDTSILKNPNPDAVNLMILYIESLPMTVDVVSCSHFMENPGAIELIEKLIVKNPLNVNWRALSKNPNAIHILEKNIDKVNWVNLSKNPNAIHILEKNIDKVCPYELSQNPNAIHILEKNINKVNWGILPENPNAIPILEKNRHLINYSSLSLNPNGVHLLVELDYKLMFESNKDFKEELVSKVLNPIRLENLCNKYNIDLDDYVEYYMD